MGQVKVLLLLLLVCDCRWLIEGGFVLPEKPVRSYLTGGYKGARTKAIKSAADCQQFANDFELLYYFPISVMVNPIVSSSSVNYAQLDPTDTFVTKIYLQDTHSLVPPSLFCLSRLQYLEIRSMVFSDGTLPDALANLRNLNSLSIYNTPLANVTDKLSSLIRLQTLYLQNCALTRLPDLSGASSLHNVDLRYNRLSEVTGLHSVSYLYLSSNSITALPTVARPESVYWLDLNNNPLKHLMTLGSFTGLGYLYLSNTTISSIPPGVDKLQQIYRMDLSKNKLSNLPTNILKLKSLRYLDLSNNSFVTYTLSSLQSSLNRTLNSTTVYW